MEKDAEDQKKQILKLKAEEARYRVLNRKDSIPRVKRKQAVEEENMNFGIGSMNSVAKFDDMLGMLGDLDMPLPSLREMANKEDTDIMNLNLVNKNK